MARVASRGLVDGQFMASFGHTWLTVDFSLAEQRLEISGYWRLGASTAKTAAKKHGLGAPVTLLSALDTCAPAVGPIGATPFLPLLTARGPAREGGSHSKAWVSSTDPPAMKGLDSGEELEGGERRGHGGGALHFVSVLYSSPPRRFSLMLC